MQWLVRETAFLPGAVRPGLVVGVVLLAAWWLILRRGIFALAALSSALLAGCGVFLLVADFVLVTHFRQIRSSRAFAFFANGVDRARGTFDTVSVWLYDRTPYKGSGKAGYTVLLLLIMCLAFAPWMIVASSPTSAAARNLYPAYEKWRKIERWSGVEADRLVVLLPTTPAPLLRRHKRGLRIQYVKRYAGRPFLISGPVNGADPVGTVVARGILGKWGGKTVPKKALVDGRLETGKSYRIKVAANSYVVRLQ